MRNAKVDIFSRLFVGLGLCLAFRVNAQQVGMSSLYCCVTLLYFGYVCFLGLGAEKGKKVGSLGFLKERDCLKEKGVEREGIEF